MPQRFLRPAIRQSKRWNRLPWDAQSLYIRLITLVDDHGRYEADPELLRSEAFPYGDPNGDVMDVTTIDNICKHLLSSGLVNFYEIDGTKYLQVLRWQERARSKSKYPDPPCKQMLSDENICAPPKPIAISHKPSPEIKKEDDSAKSSCVPPLTRSEFNALADIRGVPADCAEWFWNDNETTGWLNKHGMPIRNVEPALLNFLKHWRENDSKRRQFGPNRKPLVQPI